MKKLIAFFASLFFIVSESISQNVGIGTNTPAEKLTILTATNSYGVLHTDGNISVGTWVGNSGGYFGTKTPHPLRFFTGDAPTQMTLLTNGNLGIGTTSPAHKFSVVTSGFFAVAFLENTSGTIASDGLNIQAGSNTSSGQILFAFKGLMEQ